jgi:GxxExxY protein
MSNRVYPQISQISTDSTKGDARWQLKRKIPRTHAIIGAAMEVHRELGCGFLEPVYQEAMELELFDRAIPYQRQVELTVSYKNRPLRATYKADVICFDEVIVELKLSPNWVQSKKPKSSIT